MLRDSPCVAWQKRLYTSGLLSLSRRRSPFVRAWDRHGSMEVICLARLMAEFSLSSSHILLTGKAHLSWYVWLGISSMAFPIRHICNDMSDNAYLIRHIFQCFKWFLRIVIVFYDPGCPPPPKVEPDLAFIQGGGGHFPFTSLGGARSWFIISPLYQGRKTLTLQFGALREWEDRPFWWPSRVSFRNIIAFRFIIGD